MDKYLRMNEFKNEIDSMYQAFKNVPEIITFGTIFYSLSKKNSTSSLIISITISYLYFIEYQRH